MLGPLCLYASRLRNKPVTRGVGSAARNTGQIPAEEYWGIMRDMRRMRLLVIAAALGLTVPVVVLALILGLRLLILLPVLMTFWFVIYMPRWRRQVREHTRNLRRWKLHPE